MLARAQAYGGRVLHPVDTTEQGARGPESTGARAAPAWGATPLKELIAHLNPVLTGWGQDLRVGHARRAGSELRASVERKVRLRLTRRKRRPKRSMGWQRWSNEYLSGVRGLFWNWTRRPLPGAAAYQ